MILFAKFNQDFNIHNIAYDITLKGTESRNVRILTFLTHAGAFHSPLCIKIEYFVYKGEVRNIFFKQEDYLNKKKYTLLWSKRDIFSPRNLSVEFSHT